MAEKETAELKDYYGMIWIGDEPAKPLHVQARSPMEAKAMVVSEYGEGHVISLRNAEEANRPRSRVSQDRDDR